MTVIMIGTQIKMARLDVNNHPRDTVEEEWVVLTDQVNKGNEENN